MSSSKRRWLLRLPLLALAACGGDGNGDGGTDPGPLPGSVEVAATTTGDDLDADGYTITLDGAASRALEIDAAATFEDVEPGDHMLGLEGVATNCAVQGDNPRTLSVSAGATVETTFEVLCTAIETPPAALAFTASPGETELHQPIATVEVTIVDEEGEPVTTATHEVTLAVGVNPGASAPTDPVRPGELGGTTTVRAIEGVASFEDLAIDRRGSGYTLVATAEGLEGAESEPFDVTFAWAEVTAGSNHTCGLTPSGIAYCWGRNAFGQLGDDNAPADSDVPVAVVQDLRFDQMSAGGEHTCAVAKDNEAYCWGNNQFGQLGDLRGGTDSDTPREVVLAGGFAQVSAGNGYTCALATVTTGGTALCWGHNLFGQLGDGNAGTDSEVPVGVATELTFSSVAAGRSHTCAVARFPAASDVYCWGGNSRGQLGDDSFVESDVPVLVVGDHSFAKVGTGEDHSCALTVFNEVFCWGDNHDGQLGDGNGPTDDDDLSAQSEVPVEVTGDITFAIPSLTVGAGHTCATESLGGSLRRTVCWGRNGSGALGDGSTEDRGEPVLVEGGIDLELSVMDAGGFHTCGVTLAGEALCWGGNSRGQLGVGNSGAGTSSTAPVSVLDPPSP